MSSKKKSQKAESDEPSNSIQLSKNRYLTVSEFKNRVRVDIREYYMTEDGERRPSKKGISLSMDEWKKIVDNMDEISKMIKDYGYDSNSD